MALFKPVWCPSRPQQLRAEIVLPPPPTTHSGVLLTPSYNPYWCPTRPSPPTHSDILIAPDTTHSGVILAYYNPELGEISLSALSPRWSNALLIEWFK
ncbi:hypothetical protein DPMN_043128 [Dreissena polymorpha]|uniref:Uncharacterized protein n=1 Tax=Dreissena polymorpha TaxID=45954 RepID=A0A9D4D1R9_DREPO|nr:hypothetical protein DPMN_043128 [Dreissena polymorpha]